jgi:hypothetical protein
MSVTGASCRAPAAAKAGCGVRQQAEAERHAVSARGQAGSSAGRGELPGERCHNRDPAALLRTGGLDGARHRHARPGRALHAFSSAACAPCQPLIVAATAPATSQGKMGKQSVAATASATGQGYGEARQRSWMQGAEADLQDDEVGAVSRRLPRLFA